MAQGPLERVRVRGIVSAVPERAADLTSSIEAFGADEVEKILESTGTRKRRIAGAGPPLLCASDLCFAAASRLLQDLGWERDSIDALILVTQTPDYRAPATACVLAARLHLSKTCAAFDVNLGCSGYVYGMWLAAGLVASGAVRRALVLVGDVLLPFVGPKDRSTCLLFGDAGTATALEFSEEASPMWFVLGTDGRGYKDLIVPAGGGRIPSEEATRTPREAENGNIRSLENVYMDGSEIFAFTLREVPGMVRNILGQAGWGVQDVDAFVFHQANQFMLNHLAKRMKIPMEKVPLSMAEYGNTSGASIPVTISHCLREKLSEGKMNLVMGGFGVGLSWGAVAMTCGPMVAPPMLEVDSSFSMEHGQEIGA